MKSMTGFGKASQTLKKLSYHVEIRSINSRFIEISFFSSSRKPEIEHKISDLIKKSVHRGKLEVVIKVESALKHKQSSFNVEELSSKFKELDAVRKGLKIEKPIDLSLLADLNRNWFFKEREEVPIETSDLLKVTQLALGTLMEDRLREGAFLKKVLLKRLGLIQKSVKVIHIRSSRSVELRYEKLKERVAQLLHSKGSQANSKLEFEVAQLADKSDVTEELDRLGAHLLQMNTLFNSSEPMGRQLDFLLQEINREMNTIGSKSQDAFMTNEVISVKAELEKIREQIQNLE